jgi:excisionase family DNA binding protein
MTEFTQSEQSGNCGLAASAQLLTVTETAAMLNMSVRWVFKQCAQGSLPRVKLGRSTRLRLSDVLALMNGGVH